MTKEGLGFNSGVSCQISSTRVPVGCGEESLYPLLVLGSLTCINSGNLGSFMSGMLTIKGGKYVQVTGVVVIVSDNTDDTSKNSNKIMVNVGTSNGESNNSKDTST